MKDTFSLAGTNSCLFPYTGPSTSSSKWQVRPSLPLLHTSFLPRFHLSFGNSSSHEMARRTKKRKKKKKENILHIMRPYNENQTNLCCLACSHKDKDELPPPLHRWFIPVQFIAMDIRNKLQQNPDRLRRIVSCWCQTRMQTNGRAILGATRNFLYDKSILVLKAVALVGSVVLIGMLTLYAQAKAQAQIERHVLPPIANVVGGYLGRTVVLGKVHSVSPLGLTLESCAVGPHAEEFSCGELPLVEIRLRPVSSIQRRQLVFDAVLVQPNVLVCQKKDWSWLGIPTPTEKSHHRSALEEGLDARTKARRLSRSQIISKLSRQRELAARRAAKSGYILPGEKCNEESISSTITNSENKESETSAFANNYPMYEDIGKVWSDAVQEEASISPELPVSTPLKDYKTWFNTYFSKPVPLFKHWNMKSAVDKVETQRRNLYASASAARMYFEKLDAYDEKSKDVTESNIYVTSENAFQSLEIAGQDKKYPVHYGRDVVPAKQWDTVDDAKNVSEILYKIDNNVQTMNNTVSEHYEKIDSDLGNEHCECIQQETTEAPESKHADVHALTEEKYYDNALQTASILESTSGDSRSMSDLASLTSSKSGVLEKGSQASLHRATYLTDKSPKRPEGKFLSNAKISAINSRVKVFADKLMRQAKHNLDAAPLRNWIPATLDSVYLRGGTLTLLAYGDTEARVMENINGYVKLRNKYEQVDVQVNGKLQEWRTTTIGGNGGTLFVKVSADIRQQKWSVKLKGNNLFAPLLERLLEIPLDWSDGRASGELNIWASKGDLFPNLSGRLSVSKLAFQIWEAPSAFKDVSGTLFIQGQRLFLHNTSGFFGAIPLHVSGDMDLNPDGGEYRLVCQVPDVEANALMKTLKARPPMFPLAGAIKAAVYCRGPLEVPVFAGSAEICKKNVATALTGPCSAATEAIKQHEGKCAIAAFDKIPFSYASANFTFDTDNCVADVYGIRATLSDGGELRGAGNLWICPEGEEDPTSVNMDLSGHMLFDSVIQNYLPNKIKVSPVKLDYIHGEAKISGSLLQPVFDIKWNAPEAIGAFNGVRGDINISHEAIAINSSAFTFDLCAKIYTKYPSLRTLRERRSDDIQPLPPDIEGLDVDLRMRGFDFLGLVSPNFPSTLLSSTTEGVHTKLTGRAKFQGRVAKSSEVPETLKQEKSLVESKGITGEILLSGLKLNQFLVAPHLSGNVDIFPSMFKLNAFGRTDEHLMIGFSYVNPDGSDSKPVFKAPPSETSRKAFLFSLERGQLHMHMDYQAGHSAKLEVRNLQLDELELASLRGIVQKADAQLNFQKRKGHGVLSVRRPRFSGVQGESLDLSCRWSGDVITLERSVLEQASSRYELQGEYVLPGPRDHAFTEKETRDGGSRTAMAGQLGSFITSLGRWRLQLEVPGAEVTDLLPVARLLSRSSDPAVVSRSKELFMQGMQHAGFCAQQIKEQLEHLKNNRTLPTLEEGLQESIPLPGLAELKGHWHGTFDASGGGNGDTSADFDFHGEEWEWGTYKIQRVTSTGSYNNNEGLHLDKIFIQKDTATLHADGTLLGPKSNLHFAVLNFPVGLVPPLVHAVQSSTLQPVPFEATRTPITSIRGILYMEGDLRGPLTKPQCDVQVRLLDGVIGGVELGRAEVVASVTSSNRFNFNAKFEPATRSGHVHVRGSLPLEARGLDSMEDEKTQEEVRNLKRLRGWNRSKSKVMDDTDAEEKKLVRDRLGDEGWEAQLAESLKELDWDFSEKGAVQMDAAVKDGGMMLITALSPHLNWLQGNADLTLQVRGTVEQPTVDGVASFHRVAISSPVLPRPLSNFGGTIRVVNNQLRVEGLEGRVGRKGRLHVKGRLPLRSSEASIRDNIELKADLLEVRAKNVFSGQVDSQMRITRSILEPEVSGMIKLSHGEAYLPQEKGVNTAASSLASSLSGMATGGKLNHFPHTEVTSLPDHLREPQSSNGNEDKVEEKREHGKSLISVGLKNLKIALGPELRVVYPLILNFAVSGELELNGLADPQWIKPRGTLTFENGDVNLVATQLRLNRDHPNRARFEPEQGLDPTLDLALVGADWQLKIQGRARNWQDNLVVTSTRSGEQDAFTRTEAARVFESQLADSLLEGNGQLAFKKLAAATVETLMPKIEGKGEFGQARWRLVSAPQIPNLLSLDPTTDPFKSLANLSFGTEVEVQLGKRLQASVVRQMKESEMATQWTLIYHLSNKLRILFSSIPSVDNRLLFEYSATSQN